MGTSSVRIDPDAVAAIMQKRKLDNLHQVWLRTGGLTYRTLCRMVSGETDFKMSTWVALADALECNPLDIIRVEGPTIELSSTLVLLGKNMSIRREA